MMNTTPLKLALLGLCLSVDASAAEWFVSPTGSNTSGNGTFVQPFRTIGHVLAPGNDIVHAGDTVTLRGPAGNNTYPECEVRLRVPLTLRSHAGEMAHIHCDITNIDTVAVQIDPEASGSRLSRLEISGGYYYGVFLQTDWEQGTNESGHGPLDVIIEDSRIHDTGRDAIKITPHSDRTTIRRCEIWNSGAIYPPGTPLDDKNAEGIDNVNGSGMVVEDNYIHHTATTGVYFKGGAADVIVQRNRIENPGLAGILVGFDTSPEFFDLDSNPGYYEAIGGIVRNNIVVGGNYSGIGLYASRDAIVVNNTLIDTAALGHAAIYFGVTFQDWDENALRPANIRPLIRNNLIVQDGRPCIAIRYSDELGGLSGLDGSPGTDYNAFNNEQGACAFSDSRPGSPLDNGGNLAQWRSHTGTDMNSLEAALGLAPDGHLLPGSPAINAGQTRPEVIDDIDRQPRTGAYDIGADEVASEAIFSGGFEAQ
ncbi:MAG TPA: right-handed parallel beta-helix repeat-containing protein [Dokdonella sp.]|uniref:right-handed parallel beta-helix repeat-containing protein n=1 Tax=Dokdonella sp. TaxID=2291710 RepID=UPI002C730494|nr:right-handed parallel beta-helix repeat-containing protein [Dokdonella sp.]HOX71940.1 right-handed parallel beta-helix repeat-containing protein [Dokdonella sp.]HPG95540.1 right-handed parallel beta-helix repeat-containing protein [Dokdonella sp.]HPN80127.1 right-handed parallel beta-helix repeat-containing protein [Dokdonella sp.]